MGKLKKVQDNPAERWTQSVETGEAELQGVLNLSFGNVITTTSKKHEPTVRLSIVYQIMPAYRIYLFKGVLLASECNYFIKYAEISGFIATDQRKTREYAQRNNGRFQIEDSNLANKLFLRIHSILPVNVDGKSPVGCSSNIRIYRYTEGQSFGKHVDEDNFDKRLNGRTVFTLLIYLNGRSLVESEDSLCTAEEGAQVPTLDFTTSSAGYTPDMPTCCGGETVFYTGPGDKNELLAVAPEQGSMLLHGHGRRCLTHEGRVVTEGVKYVLRTDVVYR